MERSRVETCELSAILLCARAAGSLGTGRHWRGCAVVRVRREARVDRFVVPQSRKGIYYKYNVGYVLRGRWPYWLFPIATLHGTRLVRRNVQNDHEYGSFYTVHTADAATARPRHAATERIRALPSRGFGLDGCPRFTLLFTASQLLSRFTGLAVVPRTGERPVVSEL